MSSNTGIIVASIILASSYLASTYFSRENEPQILPTSIVDIYHLRSECGELGRKLMNYNQLPTGLSQSYQSNYDIKTNRCYVELTISSSDFSVVNYVLYDGQTNELLASLQTQKNPPTGAITDQNYHKLVHDQTFSDVDNYINEKMADNRER